VLDRSAAVAKTAAKEARSAAETAASDAHQAVSGAREAAVKNAAGPSKKAVTASPAAYDFEELTSLASSQICSWQRVTNEISDLQVTG
jgi:hypothetical protein